MKLHQGYWTHPSGRWRFRIYQYRCCGHLWEGLLSQNFPGRNEPPPCPTCPSCGASKPSAVYPFIDPFRRAAADRP